MQDSPIGELIESLGAKVSELSEDVPVSSLEARRRKKLVGDLLVLQIGAAEIAECLETQRKEAEKNTRLSKPPHVSPNILREALSAKVSNRYYNFQKFASLAEDFRIFSDGPIPLSHEAEALLQTVVHPERLELALLRELGIFLPPIKGRWNRAKYEEVKAKIAAIPKLKELIANSVPIAPSRGRGKAVAIVDRDGGGDGKILAFQDRTIRVSKRQSSIVTSASVYPDAYSYLRSRYYAENFLSERANALSESSSRLARLIVTYDADKHDAGSLERLRNEFSSRKTFFEQRAFLDRLLSVGLKNRSQDRLRIVWALHDAQKAFQDRIGKRLAFENQAKAVEFSLEKERTAWKSLYGAFVVRFSGEEDAVVRAKRVASIFEGYALSGFDFPVRPFLTVRRSFEEPVKELNRAIGLSDSAACGRALENLDLLLRSQAFWLFCFGLEHAFKTDSLTGGATDSEKLSSVIDRKIARMETMVFSGISSKNAESERFRAYADWLERFRKLSSAEKFGELVLALESVRKSIG